MKIDLTLYELTMLLRAIQVGLRTPETLPLTANEIEGATSGANKLINKWLEAS